MIYNNATISFTIEDCLFHATNLISGKIERPIPAHSHGLGCYEIHYISDGSGLLRAGGTEYKLCPGTLFVTGPLVEHSQFSDPASPMWEQCVYLRTGRIDAGKRGGLIWKFLSRSFWIDWDRNGERPLFSRLFSELERMDDGCLTMAGLLISEIMISIARSYNKAPRLPEETRLEKSERASIIIEEYFLYEYKSASLESLSKRLGLSTRQTQRVIGKMYASSFGEKKNHARMSAAAVLLGDSSLTLAEISEQLGYASQEYFTAAFKKHYGISPGRYRRSSP